MTCSCAGKICRGSVRSQTMSIISSERAERPTVGRIEIDDIELLVLESRMFEMSRTGAKVASVEVAKDTRRLGPGRL